MNSENGEKLQNSETEQVPTKAQVAVSLTCAADREALLKAVAECWPKREKLEVFVGSQGYLIYEDSQPGYVIAHLKLQDDLSDANACFLMLDEMEKAGYFPWLNHDSDVEVLGRPLPGRYICGACTVEGFDMILSPDSDDATDATICSGSTRAEAIARAFVACFAKESTEP